MTENTDVIAADAPADDSPTLDQLEKEGDIAADYIEEFLDICDLDGDIDIDARNGRAYLSVQATDADNLRLLSKPETVNALQELTRPAGHHAIRRCRGSTGRTNRSCSARPVG